MILDQAPDAIDRYNRSGLHFNLVAEAICSARESLAPFSSEYEPCSIAGLIAFDMGRMMGGGDRYDLTGRSFRSRLRAKMLRVKDFLGKTPLVCLEQIDLNAAASHIEAAYNCLAASGSAALHDDQRKQFHVVVH